MDRQIYSYDEAFQSSLEYFNGDSLAATVWIKKYAMKDADGNIYEKNPDDMHHRLAAEFARIEAKYSNPLTEEEIYDALKDFKYIIPGGSPMAGVGNEFQPNVSISNCFVIDSPADSFNGIHATEAKMSTIMKRRGGVGLDISSLRPKNAPVNNSAVTSSGAVSFMDIFNTVVQTTCQHGRRGAALISLSIKHPDSLDFINVKKDLSKINGANISVRIDDEFMKAVETDGDYTLQWPVDSDNPKYTKVVKARSLWKEIIHNAWASAEPGILFWDNIIRESIPDCYADLGFKTLSTNPCGEIPLSAQDKCIIGAANLYSFVKNPFTENAEFDYEAFEKYIRIGQRLMDDLIDLEAEKIDNIITKVKSDPEEDEIKLPEIRLWEKAKKSSELGRRVGLGITAEGDMLAAMGLKYGSQEAIKFGIDIQKKLALISYHTSVEMAKERGAFPIYDYNCEVNNPFLNRLFDVDSSLKEKMLKYGRRNIACLTMAPTGTVSLMTQTSSGIEPVFMTMYKRRRKVNPDDSNAHVDFVDENTGESFEEYVVFHHNFKKWMELNGITPKERYTQKELDDLVAISPYAGATANEIDWHARVEFQGGMQKFVDHSISSTVNLPNNITEDVVSDLYMTAWKSGAKGITVYRDGSRSGVLVSTNNKDNKNDEKIIENRPKSLNADVIRFKNNKEQWIAFVGKLDNGQPYEIFTGLIDEEEGLFDIPKSVTSGKIVKKILEDGKKSYDFEFSNKKGNKIIIEGLNSKFNPEYWNYSKLLSSVLRYHMPMNYVLHLVDSLDLHEEGINSWKSGVKRALKKYIKDGDEVVGGEDKCPDCGAKLRYENGCVICPNCGYSKCG